MYLLLVKELSHFVCMWQSTTKERIDTQTPVVRSQVCRTAISSLFVLAHICAITAQCQECPIIFIQRFYRRQQMLFYWREVVHEAVFFLSPQPIVDDVQRFLDADANTIEDYARLTWQEQCRAYDVYCSITTLD